MRRSRLSRTSVTTTVPVGARDFDPYDLFRLAPPYFRSRVAWRAFDEATTYIGYGEQAGTASSVLIGDESPLEFTGRRVRTLATTCLDAEGRPTRGRARFFGGFAFDPLEPWGAGWADLAFFGARFTLPEVEFAVRRNATRITAPTALQDEPAIGASIATLAEQVLQLASDSASRPPPAARAIRPVSGAQPGGRGPLDALDAVGADRPIDPVLADRLTRALVEIDAGTVEKVVVATSRTVPCDIAHGDVPALAGAVASAAPGCTAYLIALPPIDADDLGAVDGAWLGATPERLVRVRGNRMWTMALAGTARRGATAAEDRALGAALLASDKDRREHAAVVDAVCGVLAQVPGLDVTVAPKPRLRRLATLQHLETPITARSRTRLDVLDIALRLHPTPALAGAPKEAALDLIAALEPDGRGWYGGAVGWIDGTGDGDLAVGIRGILLHDRQATAYAGAGLVAGSDVDSEAREIELKLATTLAPLSAFGR